MTLNQSIRYTAVALLLATRFSAAALTLEEGWQNPPKDAKLRAYWWWINGNVTREAITRDLEEMKAKGFGGALICDADGSSQEGNARAPHGPTFFSPEWRELYKHTLREADRLGLEMSLNIQSGWNLGGPMVKAEDAPKKLSWSEARVAGGGPVSLKLDTPARRDNFYRDLFVLAYRAKSAPEAKPLKPVFSASSAQANQSASLAGDADAGTFWVSDSTEPGRGPTPQNPQWLQLEFAAAVTVSNLSLQPRDTYGPRDCELLVSDDGRNFQPVKRFECAAAGLTPVTFPATRARFFRVQITSAFDPKFPASPRNVQVAELSLSGNSSAPLAGSPGRDRLKNQREKALLEPLRPFSAPDSAPLFQEFPATPGEEDLQAGDVLEVSDKMAADGTLNWTAPPGEWQVLRFGWTLNDHCRVSTCSEGWDGYALDPFDDGAFTRYWDAVVEPLIQDAGPLAGKALKYLHTDSWEVEVANWTPHLREEFKARRGYDLLPWLPVIAGKIVNSRDESNRFLNDFRRTMGDLAIAHHYLLFKERAHRHGLLIHPESGGPHAVPIDAQQCLGFNDAPMSEFWAWSWTHRVGDANRFFVKQPASAAHTYGHKLVLAEGFTTIGPHWQEKIWDNLKPSFDKALCEGLNLLVWHAFVCSPASEGVPGQQYFAGTHLNPNVTWWAQSAPFFSYINRSQWLLQQGHSSADVLYYYGDHVPNFARLKASDPAHVLPGFDYDVITAEALLERTRVRDGKIVLPDGVNYRVLVLPDRDVISLPVLKKIAALVREGATVIGPKPARGETLENFAATDAEVKRIADELWGGKTGRGRVVSDRTAREVLLADGIAPDCEFSPGPGDFDYIHRTDGQTEIYFVANRTNAAAPATVAFRVSGKAPELWNPVTGEHRFAAAYAEAGGRTRVPLEFAPCGSWFVIFREPASQHPALAPANATALDLRQEISGAWTVHFDPKWGGPESVLFDALVSWPQRPEPGIRFYSGTAVYEKTFDVAAAELNASSGKLFLDLGNVREIAGVKVNGKSCGTVWCPPWRVEVTDAVKAGENRLQIEVVNFWPNRLIGDAGQPVEQRLTRTNIRKLTARTPLEAAGLLGPVRLLAGSRDRQ